MTQYNCANAEVLLYDPLPANLAVTRTSLLALGFLRISTTASIVGLTNALVRHTPHLLISNCNRDDGWLLGFIQNLRQANTVHNPFLPVILTSWDRGADFISTAVDSGADDFMVRPVSTEILGQRIALIVEKRKPFVVSSGYVGPDRRLGRSLSSSSLFCPPNVLKCVLERRFNSTDRPTVLDRDLADERRRLHYRKLRCDALRLGAYVRQWQEAKAPCRADYLARMQGLAKSMRTRSEELGDASLIKSCSRLLASLVVVDKGKEVHGESVEKAAGSLYALLATDATLEKFRREVGAYFECLVVNRSSQLSVDL